jgi:STE24 endopeptidase
MAYFSAAELQAMAQAGVHPPVITPQLLSYCRLQYGLIFASFAYTVLTLFGIVQFGVSSFLARLCQKATSRKWLQVPLYCVLLAAVILIIRLPFSWYATYYVDHSYGLSHQSLASWFSDLLKSKAVGAFIDVLTFTLAFAIIDRFRKRWPIIVWLCLLPLIAAGIFLAPVLVDPLFNKFELMPPSATEAGIREVAKKAGIPDAPIFVVDKSKQTNKINAYVTGLGSSNRIVIWDNTLKKLPADQVESVVAHESGHYVLGHILLGFLLICAGLLVLFLVVSKYADAAVVRLPGRWGVRSITDLTAIPVIMLFASIGTFLFAPLDNAISREMEHQADEFGINVTHDPAAMARTFVSLSQENLSEPQPPAMIEFWLFSHPSLRERILFALSRAH